MLRILLIALFCLPIVASAQGSKTREVTLPMGRMFSLFNSIAQLDGYDRAVKDGANERIVNEKYKFERGFRSAMSRNMSALKPIIEAFDKERQALQVEYGAHNCTATPSPECIKFNIEERRLLALEHKASLFTIAEAELKLDQNPIPIAILSALDPIMEYPQ